MWNNILKYMRRAFSKKTPKYGYRMVAELPDELSPESIYLQTHLDQPWQAVMVCPCGCGEHIHLNLVRKYRPAWSYKLEKKTITLSPSINRTAGCRSHFFVRSGRIEWCGAWN
jgi:hypothetical protein